MFFLPLFISLALFQWGTMGSVPIDNYVILRLADQSPMPIEQLVERLLTHRVVLVGEAHDNPAHHQVQLMVIERLHARHAEMAIAMEMFPGHLQPQLDRWVAGELDEEAFLDGVEWYFTCGFDSKLYLPILRFAKEKRIPLLAMNIARERVKAVRKQGLAGVDQTIRDQLPPMYPPPLAYRIRLEEVFNSHPMISAGGKFDYFVESQGVWDGVMADSIKTWSDAHPHGLVVGLVGSGHLLMGHGIPYQLRQRGLSDLVTLLPWSGEESWIDREAADFAWGTSVAPDVEPPVRFGVVMDEKRADGVWVEKVMDDSLAAKAGLLPKDRIRQLNGQAVTSRHALVRMVRGWSQGGEVVVVVEREGRDERIKFTVQ